MPSVVLAQLDRFGPDRCETLTYEQAAAYTAELTRTQYENFTVVSWLLPARLREHFRHVYSFCRWADDLGDETGDVRRSLDLLAWWRTELDRCYDGRPRHPVFVALRPTIEKFDIPRKPLDDLIDAFVQDQTVIRYETWEQVLDYCTRSADPVGRLVLYLCGFRDEQRQRLSDATCTALQLANFWQDVRRDVLQRDRVYIPADVARRHGLDIASMAWAIKADSEAEAGAPASLKAIRPPFQATMRELVDRTQPLFATGRGLWPLLPRDVRVDIQLFTFGGESILKMIRRQRYDTLTRRPALSKFAKLMLMARAVAGKVLARSPVHSAAASTSSSGERAA